MHTLLQVPELQLENDTTINNIRLDRSSDMVNDIIVYIILSMYLLKNVAAVQSSPDLPYYRPVSCMHP